MPIFGDIFEWRDWENGDEYKYYYNCKLLIKIDEYEIGTVFDTIIFNDEKLTVEFYETDSETPVMSKKLALF